MLISSLANFSLDSVYLLVEQVTILRRTRFYVSFPNQFESAALCPEFMVEVVRHQSHFRGGFGVAAKLVENIQLRLCDGLLVPQDRFWKRWPLIVPTRLNVYV